MCAQVPTEARRGTGCRAVSPEPRGNLNECAGSNTSNKIESKSPTIFKTHICCVFTQSLANS